MSNFLREFVEKMPGVTNDSDAIQLFDQVIQKNLQDSFGVCLRIDQETFEFQPVRAVDKALFQNVEPYIDQGICAEALMSGKPFYVFDSRKYDLKEDEGLILFPMIFHGENFGIIMIVTKREECKKVLNESQDDMNDLCAVVSKLIETYHKIELSVSEKSLVEQNNITLDDIVESVVHGVMVFNAKNEVILFNQNSQIMFGVTREEVLGKSYREVFSERIVRSFDLLLQNTKIEGSILDFELEVDLGNDTKIPLGISTSLVVDEKGEEKGYLFISRDMSLTKEVNRLKELDQMKSEFVSTVSHELKNPIAVIKSTVEIMLTARKMGKNLGEDFEQNSMLTINGEIDRLSELIHDLLSLSKMESGKVELNRRSIDIEDMMGSIINLFKVSEKTHPINLTVKVTDLANIDEEKVKQVVINYINNAIKYSPDGSEINVSVLQSDGKLTVSVKDQGLGIPEAQLARVFDKFHRVQTDETSKISGTGLGLAICKKIIELHHGKVWVNSKHGEGSTFGFDIPLTAIAQEAIDEQ